MYCEVKLQMLRIHQIGAWSVTERRGVVLASPIHLGYWLPATECTGGGVGITNIEPELSISNTLLPSDD